MPDRVQTMSGKSNCAEAAAKAYLNKTVFHWGNREYTVPKVEIRGNDLAVTLREVK